MKKSVLIIFMIAGLVYSQQHIDIPWPTLAKTDWPMIKHDPQFTGRSPYKGPQTPTVVWTVDMPYGIFSGPLIGEAGNLYFGSYFVDGDNFYSYSSDANHIWTYQTGSGRATQAGILIDSSNTIYFGSRDSCLYALNPNGTFKWKYITSASIYQEVIPNIDLQGNLYITNSNWELYSIKPNGTLNWMVSYENGFGSGSPVFSPDGNTIYIAGRDSNLFAINLDGSLKWKFSCGRIVRAPMIDSDGKIYFIPRESPQHLYSLEENGTIRWKYFFQDINPADAFTIPTIDYKGNIYFVGFDTTCCPYYTKLISLTYAGDLRWEYIFDDEEVDDFWQPLICDSEGTVYVGSTFGYNYYAISSEGELKWKLPLLGQRQQVDNTGAIAKDGTLYLGVHDISLFNGQIKTLIAIRDTGSTGIIENTNIIKYQLNQNYPNPFNSTTNIKYTIPQSDRVTIKVFDLMGREVVTLLDRYQQAGSYDVIFQADNLASGIYFYQLQASEFIATKKLILLR